MNTIPAADSDAARARLLSVWGEPAFHANWDNALFVHYETDPALLQRSIPYPLDLFAGRAFVSLVAFRLREMRPRLGGRLGALFCRPIATHEFLNVRTYVKHRGEQAIYFMHEWLNNRLSVLLGPVTFGLPYHYAAIEYRDHGLRGVVRAGGNSFSYQAELEGRNVAPAEPGSLSEFLLERYTAFTPRGRARRFFRIWHEPWQQAPARIRIADQSLLATSGGWQGEAELAGANYSPGVDVWMGRPLRVRAIGS